MIADFHSIDLATSGEITVHPKRKEIYDVININKNIVLTNGFKFDNDLFLKMENYPVRLLVSIDAGTRETYARIKGFDCFDKVCENLKRYASSKQGLIMLKYVFVSGLNDFEKDVDGFVKLCDETGAVLGIVSYDLNSHLSISEHIKSLMRRLKDGLSSINILCVPFNASNSNDSFIREVLRK
jgi:MoaA/NifB/PqqE/SkfB family radical SAM enzyme